MKIFLIIVLVSFYLCGAMFTLAMSFAADKQIGTLDIIFWPWAWIRHNFGDRGGP
jgi:hypothetical protein